MAEVIKTIIDVELNSGQFSADLKALQQQVNAFNLTLNKSAKAQGTASKIWADDLSKLINRSGYFKAELTRIQTSAAALDSTLRKGQSTLGQFFSAAFNKRSAMAAEVFGLAAERARTMQTQFIATGKAARGMQDVLAVRPLTAFVSEASIASQRMQILGSMFKQGTTQLINFGKNVQWAGRQLMVGFTVPLTIFGATAGRVFRDLEKEVVSFKKVYGDLFTTPAELNANLEAVKGLAAEYTKYGVAVKDTINLAAQAAAAGRQNSELTDAVREATRLATLGQMDQNRALEATIALQSAFRLSGQELTDTINFLNMVENQTVVSLDDIAAAIPRVAPVIKGLGGDVKDLSVFLAAMQEGGVSAEQGANALKSGLASLINPTKNAKSALADFNINLDAIIQKNRGDLMGTVMDFAQALKTLDDFSRQQALEEVFGKFQYARLGALFENIVRDGSQASQVMDTMAYSSEELRKTAEKELNTLSESFGVQLQGAIERLKLSIAPIGELFVKMAIPIVNLVTRLANWFNSLPEGTKKIAAIATVITGLVVPAATMMFGLFMNLVGTLAKMSQGAVMFGTALVKGGPVAALRSLTTSSQYLSLAEIDAANAARQLGSATSIANAAILEQGATARSSKAAIDSYTASLMRMVAAQTEAALVQPAAFKTGKTAAAIAVSRGRKKFAKGGTVPGVGNTDTVPAMLTPGEFVVTKDATKNNLGLLKSLNSGGIVRGYANGGEVFGLGVVEDSLDPKIQKGLSSSKMLKGSISSSFSEAAKALEFSGGKTNPNESRKAYMMASELYDSLGNNTRAKDKFIEDLTARSLERGRLKGKAKVNTTIVQAAYSKLLKSGLIGDVELINPKTGKPTSIPSQLVDTKKLLSYLELKVLDRSHIGSRIETLANPLETGHGRIPAGTPVQFLNNKVLDLADTLNKRLSKKGVSPAELVKEIDSGRSTMFQTLNGQFEEFVKESKLNPRQEAELRKEFLAAKDDIFKTYKDEISKVKGLITDRGQNGSTKFGDVTDKVFKKLRRNKLLEQFDDLLSFEENVRIPPGSDLKEIAKKLNSEGAKINLSGNRGQLARDIVEWNTRGDLKQQQKALAFIDQHLNFGKDGKVKSVKQTQFTVKNAQKLMADLRRMLPKIAFATVRAVPGMNTGGTVPGIGNTDTIPAMLTPGEFVVNKEATKNNLDLLKSINNGKAAGYNKGGKVRNGILYANTGVYLDEKTGRYRNSKGQFVKAPAVVPQAGGGGMGGGVIRGASMIGGAIAGQPIFGMTEQFGGMVGSTIAGFAAMSAASKIISISLKKLTKQPVRLAEEFAWTAKAFKLMRIPVTGLSMGLAGLTVGAVALGVAYAKQRKEFVNAGAKLTEAMYGSADTIKGLSSVFGSQTATESLAESRIARAGGGISEEAQQFATQYMQSDPGKDLLKQIELIKKSGGDAAEAIRNQLIAGVVSGVINPDQAKAIAGDIGLALNDQNLAIQATGQIAKLIGPNGELLQNNILNIVAQITPSFNTVDIMTEAQKQFDESGFLNRLFSNEDTAVAENAINTVQQRLQSANNTIAQSIASVTRQYEEQEITYEDYKKKVDSLSQELVENNQKSVDSFLEITGIVKEDLNELYNFTPGKGTSGTQTAKQAQMVKDFFNNQREIAEYAMSGLGEGVSDQISDAIMQVAEGDVAKAGEIFSQMATGTLSNDMINQIYEFMTSQGLEDAARAFRNKFRINVMTQSDIDFINGLKGIGGVGDQGDGSGTEFPSPPGDEKESAFARIQREARETRTYLAGVKSLTKDGLNPANIALLKQGDFLEMSNSQRKQAIKLLKEQTDAVKLLEYALLSSEERNIKNLQDNIKILDREITLNQRKIDDVLKLNKVEEERIDNLQRQNELDQRQIALRNKALDQISDKEDNVNKVYNARFEALDKVAQINDRLAQQQQDRIALAGALTSGDFAGAATAAAQMSSNFASNQLQDTRAALEDQRNRELASITAEVNGQLLTREQLETQIDIIGERVYQRNLLIQQQEDIIFEREQQIKPFKEAINSLEERRLQLTRDLEDAEYNKWKTELDNLRTAAKGWESYWSARRGGKAGSIGSATKSSSTGGKKPKEKQFGGFIKRAYGGMINFRGSTEAPPALLRANSGMEVPGIGMTDKVPALLTPGEFVVRKSAAQANMPLLKAINSNVFPEIESLVGDSSSPIVSDNSASTINAPVYNNYNVNVNVAETDASANDIANAVIQKIKMSENRGIRRNRV